jgi:hypothetical protein
MAADNCDALAKLSTRTLYIETDFQEPWPKIAEFEGATAERLGCPLGVAGAAQTSRCSRCAEVEGVTSAHLDPTGVEIRTAV